MEWTIKRDLWKVLVALLAFIGLMVATPVLAADPDYKVVYSNYNPVVGTQLKWSDDIVVQWDAPGVSSEYTLNGYLYLWNNSDRLSDADLATLKLGEPTTEKVATKSKADLLTRDYSVNPTEDVIYLHVITQCLNKTTSAIIYSSDVPLGPFQIDNVAPKDGNVRIVDSSGNTIASTKSSDVMVNLAASGAIGKYYLSESESSSTQQVTPISGGVSTALSGGTLGSHTLYAWFEDPAGNKSSTPATASVTLLGSIYIDPDTATIDLASPTQKFLINGSDAAYTWSVSDANVASISGSPGNSITVTGLKVGTFTLKAVRTGQTDLFSGTITVVQGYTKGDVNNDGLIDSGDAILVLRYSVGLTTLTDTQKAAGNCTSKASNNDIDSGDAIKILRYSVGLITSL
jgi:hypothetical protein